MAKIEPGDFWFSDPPAGDLTIVEIISKDASGSINILPIGQELQTDRGWNLLAKIMIPDNLRGR